MFECKYKYELDDALQCSKYIYKASRRTKDKIVSALIPIMLVCMVGILIWDIIKSNNYIWDIVLIVALVVLQILNMIMPLTLTLSQKKAFKKQRLAEMDGLTISIKDDLCIEELEKDGKEMAKGVHGLRSLTSYMEDSTRLILIFNKIEFVCLRKDAIIGGSLDELKAFLEKALIKNNIAGKMPKKK